jgi:hypothetical protein
VLYPSDYEHFVVPNTILDRELTDSRTQERTTLRAMLGLQRDVLTLDGLERFPFHFRVGTGALLTTTDDYWVLSVRSNRQFVAPDVSTDCLRLHVSVAEGMLRGPTAGSGDTTSGDPDPFRTVERALADELNLHAARDYDSADIGCIGYYLDRTRAQPFLAFQLRSDRLTLASVFERWTETPPDRHENLAIIGVRASAANAARLLAGRDLTPEWVQCPAIHATWLWGNGSRRAVMASNHARTVLSAGALAACGVAEVRAEIQRVLPSAT